MAINILYGSDISSNNRMWESFDIKTGYSSRNREIYELNMEIERLKRIAKFTDKEFRKYSGISDREIHRPVFERFYNNLFYRL